MHLVIPRGPHTQADVEAHLPVGYSVLQWWPVTIVGCNIQYHPDEWAYVQDRLHHSGIPSKLMQHPAILCEPCTKPESTVCGE